MTWEAWSIFQFKADFNTWLTDEIRIEICFEKVGEISSKHIPHYFHGVSGSEFCFLESDDRNRAFVFVKGSKDVNF